MYAAGPSSGVRSSEELIDTTTQTRYSQHVNDADDNEPKRYYKQTYPRKQIYESNN